MSLFVYSILNTLIFVFNNTEIHIKIKHFDKIYLIYMNSSHEFNKQWKICCLVYPIIIHT